MDECDDFLVLYEVLRSACPVQWDWMQFCTIRPTCEHASESCALLSDISATRTLFGATQSLSPTSEAASRLKPIRSGQFKPIISRFQRLRSGHQYQQQWGIFTCVWMDAAVGV